MLTKGEAKKNESTRKKTSKNKGARGHFIQRLIKKYYDIQNVLTGLPS